ncbi:MAG: hypothetical protein Q9162_006726 [Coniocarpon cinnabarinum]
MILTDSDTFSVLDRKYRQLGLSPEMWKRASRHGVTSFYSKIDGDKDTVYLTVDRGRPIAQHQAGRPRSPSPDFSDFDNDSLNLKPPIPLKNIARKMQFGKKKSTKNGLSARQAGKVSDWERRQQAQQQQQQLQHTPQQPLPNAPWNTQIGRDSPELPDPDMGVSLREDMPVDLHDNSHFSWTTYADDEPPSRNSEIDALPDLSSLTFTPTQTHTQPRSRFSWSTHNTSVRRSIDQKSLNSPSPAMVSSPPSPPLTPPSSVLTRRRPLPRPDEYGFYPEKQQIKRKPTPSEAASLAPQSSPIPPQSTSETDDIHDLPLFPPRTDSADKAKNLQVELNTLENRKYNLTRVIGGLTALVPSNPVEFDLAKRREHKARVEAFERELADVRRREHELGMRLQRIMRRREGGDEPTGLWVRRVTG